MSESNAALTGTDDVTSPTRSTPRNGALNAYRWALLAFLAAGVVQIFLAGLGVFSLQDQGLVADGDSAFAPHRTLGYAMAGIAIVVLIIALIARAGARAIAGMVLLVLLTSLVQSLLAGLADHHAIYGALHALDGLLILSVAAYLYLSSRGRAASSSAEGT
jgi:Family of unknown function (DUF6220)